MRIVVTWILVAVSAGAASTLLFSVPGVLRRRGPTPWKWAAMVALMMIALGGLHSLTPAATTPLLYLCVPAALVGAALILLCGSKGPTFGAPLQGPDRHAPAMAKRPALAREDADGMCEVVDGRKRIA
jgi:tellurite resistance protein TehA-like permease